MIPNLGINVRTLAESPNIEENGFIWLGSWLNKGNSYELVGWKWQCKTCGIVKDIPFNHQHNNLKWKV